MQSKCSIKTFQFRHIKRPGILLLDEERRLLEFNAYGLTAADSFSQTIPIDLIEKVELSKGLFHDTLSLYYDGEWYKWTDFLDDHYQGIFKALQDRTA